MNSPLSIDELLKRIARRTDRVISDADLRAKLERSAKTGKPLRIKLGMDPTAPDVTLGHAVPLKVIRAFQDAGHKAVLIIGDYTARVGDPSGRNATRPVLSGAQIDANAKTYVDQVGKILLTDPDHLEVRYNGQWLGNMSMTDIIKLVSRKSVAQVLAREDFSNRFNAGVDIRLHELMYPLLQGWDSVVIDADVELGGSDQLFNNLVGREFQKEEGKEGQVVIVTPLLVGTDGAIKMSKSKGNYIGVTDPATGGGGGGSMFGKIMSLPDKLLASYYQLLTDIPEQDYTAAIAASPRDAKIALAKHIISWLHSPEAAAQAEDEFKKVIVGGGMPDEMPEIKVGNEPVRIVVLLVRAGFVASNSEGFRKLKEGAVKLDGEKLLDDKTAVQVSMPRVLQLGNRKFVRLVP